jgi:hypothetical protein
MRFFHVVCSLIVFLFISVSPLFAQEKFEKESRIRKKDIPTKALQFVEALPLAKKVKWYREEGLTNTSIEAKFRYEKKRYSVEFDTTGNVQDVELNISKAGLPSGVLKTFCVYLKANCSKHNINKVQIQYTGEASDLLSVIKGDDGNLKFNIYYEVVVVCTYEKKTDLFEYLINEEGEVLSSSKIIFKNSTHLEY